MNHKKQFVTLCTVFSLLLALAFPVLAEQPTQVEQRAVAGAIVMHNVINEAKVRDALFRSTGSAADVIRPSVMPGIAEVLLGGQVLYISNDGRFIFNGDLFDTTTSQNISESLRANSRVTLINEEMAKGRAITYKTKGEPKYRLAVFTDIDCGYCREFHKHIEEFAELGIEINYFMMPRSGVGTPSYFKALNAVCAENPQKALTSLKQGQKVEDLRCDDTRVIDSLEMAQKLGVRGTPAALALTGELISGYRQPQEFLKILDEIEANRKSQEK